MKSLKLFVHAEPVETFQTVFSNPLLIIVNPTYRCEVCLADAHETHSAKVQPLYESAALLEPGLSCGRAIVPLRVNDDSKTMNTLAAASHLCCNATAKRVPEEKKPAG